MRSLHRVLASASLAVAALWTAHPGALHAQVGSEGWEPVRSQQHLSATVQAQRSRQARQHRRNERMQVQRARQRQQAQRAQAHARMKNTMYASTPSPADGAVSWHPALVPPDAQPRDGFVAAAPPPVPVLASPMSTATGPHRIPLFPSASDSRRGGFARIINHSDAGGTVRIDAFDDAGEQYGPLTLSIGAGESVHFSSSDLEKGNPDKGLAGATGPGEGGWRLEMSTSLDLQVLSYIRTRDGFVTSMHDLVPRTGAGHRVAFFNPGSNAGQVSRLRLINPGAEAAEVSIEGIDGHGESPGSAVQLSLPARTSRTLTARQLESGVGEGLSGALGDGAGKWRLLVHSEQPIRAMSLLSTPTGHLTNLSTVPDNADSDEESATTTHHVPLFPSTSDPRRGGFARVINHSDAGGTVRIDAFDDAGGQYGPLTLSIGAGESVHFSSSDLEKGNPGKGLAGATGPGEGGWRLEMSTSLDLQVLSYIRTRDGFVTSMHDLVPRTEAGHRVAFFNPGSNVRQVSRLRLINPGEETAEVSIEGIDGHGESPGSAVRLSLPARTSRTLTARQLESGEGEGLSGALGDGAGKWRLLVHSEQPIRAMSLLSTPTGHLTNLSTAPDAVRRQTAEEVFRQQVSEPVVQSKCVNCHVAGGISGHTRLVFVPSSNPDHLALNLRTFKDFFAEVEGAAALILNKIQGVGHGGGVQVPAGTADFANMERFIELLGGGTTSAEVTPKTLFDPVRMEPLRKTLRRAALIFAGRLPTEEEYASISGGGAAMRATLRNLMTGPEFHEFLIRASNDRLLTDRELRSVIIDPDTHSYFADFANENHRRYACGDPSLSYHYWDVGAQYGVGRAPLELIAHVVENDLPYTEILTADYIMANPYAAGSVYRARTRFDDPEDVYEFKPSRIRGYYRRGDGFREEHSDCGLRVFAPAPLLTHYPHAGILNTTVFLQRYPSTATNRNRARARWTWYHFLGLDVEKSASRTTDPEALADTNNPTLHNPACTVCHRVLDPVAGAFQNYGDEGMYRDQWGGLDSLDEFYKEASGEALAVQAASWRERETLRWTLPFTAGVTPLRVTFTNYFWDGSANIGGAVYLDRLTLTDARGRAVAGYEFEDLESPIAPWGNPCGYPRDDHFALYTGQADGACRLGFDVEVPADGLYNVEVVAWADRHERYYGEDRFAKIAVAQDPYRLGDTWYRDMRAPGFDGASAPDPDNSVQWLAKRIVADRRFAEAAVKFWWPAIMGSEVAEPPEDEDDADFEGRLLAANAQGAEVQRLADGFRRGFRGRSRYNLKDLLVEIVLSRWFRAEALTGGDPIRNVALRDAGARRLLTPEELARKTASVTGYQWGRWIPTLHYDPDYLTGDYSYLTGDYRLLYGGIDSDGITERARDVTTVMAGVAKRHAVHVSGPVVLREFYLWPEAERRLFAGIDKAVTPVSENSTTFEIEVDWPDWEAFTFNAPLKAGPKTVTLTYTNDYCCDEDTGADRNIRLDRLEVRNAAGRVVTLHELGDLEASDDCNRPEHDHYYLQCSGGIEVPIAVPATGSYTIEIVASADHAGSELPELLVSVESDTENSAGAEAIRNKLVELHDKLLGVDVTPWSPDVEAAYRLFVEVWRHKREDDYIHWWHYDINDLFYYEGIVDDAVKKVTAVEGWDYSYDRDRIEDHMDGIDFSDPHATVRTWTVVLAYLLMDYRYLYL